MSQDHELGAHVRGALNNGCTPEEIMEAIYQVRIHDLCVVSQALLTQLRRREYMLEFLVL